jgi:RNA polymerase sigma factor (sigma-70 family)
VKAPCRYEDAELRPLLRYPLLTTEQELQLARQVQRMLEIEQLRGTDDTKAWADRCGVSPRELQRAVRVGQRAKDRMILSNLRLVVTNTRPYLHRCGSLDAMDLFQEGCIGLERAVERFNPARGYKFSTYATWWIRQAITRAIENQSRVIRLPVHTAQAKALVIRAMEAAMARGEQLTLEQACGKAGKGRVSLAVIRAAERCWTVESLDRPADGIDSDSTLGDLVAIDHADEEEPTSRQQLLRDALEELDPEQRTLLKMFYGIDTEAPSRMEDLATKLNIKNYRNKLHKARSDLRDRFLSIASQQQ